MKKPLVVIPTYMTKQEHLDSVTDTLLALGRTAPNQVEILVVDDHSPSESLVEALRQVQIKSQEGGRVNEPPFELVEKKVNSGFSATVNVGMRRALNEERDVVLINSDIEMHTPGWVETCQETADLDGFDAAVVGALLVYPQSGLIQHAGINFSYLSRRFFERYKYGPADLPSALHAEVLPVTGAFQYIRHQALTLVGIYDEDFQLGFEDVDYCIRVFKAGLCCVYNPAVRAFHFESMVRGEKTLKVRKWEAASWQTFVRKYAGENFARYCPAVL